MAGRNGLNARMAVALREAERLTQKYGTKAGDTGASQYDLGITSTGVLALDYALGIGGWPEGHLVMVFGPPDIGKSSSLGLAAIREAQKAGKLCGIIALEPNFDKQWAIKHGVIPDLVVIARPNTGEEAFEILIEWVEGDLVDFVLFDSLGALVGETEREEGAKARVGGASKLITDGTKRILMPCWKNRKTVLFMNQIRDDLNSRVPGMVKPPGGHGQEHASSIILQLKPGKDQYKLKIDGEEVLIGRTIVAVVKRNKLAQGSNQRAQFDFYQKEVDGYPFGIDTTEDVIATGMMTGVIRLDGSWYKYDGFPGGKVQGKKGVSQVIRDDPTLVDVIRGQVLARMFKARAEADETMVAV